LQQHSRAVEHDVEPVVPVQVDENRASARHVGDAGLGCDVDECLGHQEQEGSHFERVP
jgi:hypothetical protein